MNKIDESISELLKPRYKVIADYPGSDFEIGDILTKAESCYAFEIEPGRIRQYSAHMVESYPHLFQPLPWYAKRKESEISEIKYVKWQNTSGYKKGEIEKVESFSKFGSTWCFKIKSQKNEINAEYFIPATQSDYETFINQKQK